MQLRRGLAVRLAGWATAVLALAVIIDAASAAGSPAAAFAAEAAERNDASGDYLVRKKDELQRWVAARLAELDRQGEALQERASAVGEKARGDWREFQTIITAYRKEIDGKLDEAKTASAETWDQIKQETERAVEALERRYNAFGD